MGKITFEGVGPYDLPYITGIQVRKNGDRFVLCFRLWKSENEWTLVRALVSEEQAHELARRIGDATARADGSAVV